MAISSPLKPKVSIGSVKTVKKFQTILFNRTKVKKEIFQRKTILQNRRVENERRKQLEDELEAPNLVRTVRGPSQLIAGSAKGFFDRLIGFLGYLTAGWIINNLPTWISMGKEFIARTQQMGKILGNFIVNSTDIFKNFTRLLGATLTNLMEFDFLDTSGRVSTAFDELNLSVENWGTGFEDVIKLITTPLTEGIASGEDARPLGTENTNEGAYERTAPYSGSGGSTTTYSSTGGKKISKSEFGNRGFRTRDGLGSGATAFGHTGRDVPMPGGTPLSVVPPGVVVEASTGYNGGYGNFVTIKLDDGRFIKLNHLSAILVKPGDKVGTGSGKDGGVRVVGKVGSTGLSTGPHMHLDLGTGYNRGPAQITGLMDPDSFILNGGVVKGGNVKSTGEVTQTKPPASQPQQNLMGQPTPSGGTLSTSQLVALAKQVGMTKQVNVKGYKGPLDVLMGAVGMQESRGKSTSMRSDTQVYGLWQIRFPVHRAALTKIGVTSPQQLYDPLTNAKAAKMIYDSQGITAWSGFTDGKYKQFLPEAQKAAGIAPSSLTASATPQTPQSKPPSPAQITPTGTPQNPQIPQSLAPERKGQTVIVSQNPSSPARQMMYSGGGGSSGGGSSPISDFALLNNFIKNKLLLDLAYL